jgi:nucleoid DNA-binding protein
LETTMSKQHVSYSSLRERIATRANLRHKQVDGAFSALAAELAALPVGGTLAVRDLGRFTKVTRKARLVKSLTGQVVMTKPRDVVTFKARK